MTRPEFTHVLSYNPDFVGGLGIGLDLAGIQVGAELGAELSVDVGPVLDGAFLDVGVLDAADGPGNRVQQPGLGAVVEDFAVQRAGLVTPFYGRF
jgi:hypothetical protein